MRGLLGPVAVDVTFADVESRRPVRQPTAALTVAGRATSAVSPRLADTAGCALSGAAAGSPGLRPPAVRTVRDCVHDMPSIEEYRTVKSTVEHLSPTRVKITVEVPFDELKPNFDRAYKKIAGQVRVPGFRPGKVPARIIDARLGRGTILTEVVNDAVPAKYREAVTAAETSRRSASPEIEVTQIDDGEQLAFTAEVDVRPEITLPDARRRSRSPSTTSRSPTPTSTSSWRTCATGSAR